MKLWSGIGSDFVEGCGGEELALEVEELLKGGVGVRHVGDVSGMHVKYRPDSTACENKLLRAVDVPYVKTVLSSLMKGRPCWAIFLGACFARLTKTRELPIRDLRRVVKSECW